MIKEAKIVLESFIREMKAWEMKWGRVLEQSPHELFSEDGMELRLTELVNVQNKYLSEKALLMQQDRRITLTFGVPPEYDQKIVNENVINDKTSEFVTVNNEEKECRVYTLVNEKLVWKIDLMKIDSIDWKSSRQVF